MSTEFEYSGSAMGTEFSIAIVCYDKGLADTQAKASIERIKAYEARFSRFLPMSELSLLNTEKDMEVSEEFMNVIVKARELFTETKGMFNPLVQISRLGYTKTFDEIKEDDTIDAHEPYDIDFSTTRIDQERNRVTLMDGQKLDFGGFLKGYLAELLAKGIKDHSPLITGTIVNIGGDIHTEGVDADNMPFDFTIHNPVAGRAGITLTLHNESLATSGTYKRVWNSGGTQVHHILGMDGRDNPDTDIISASVIHKDGSKSEAYTKVLLGVGEARAQEIIHDDTLRYVLIMQSGDVTTNII